MQSPSAAKWVNVLGLVTIRVTTVVLQLKQTSIVGRGPTAGFIAIWPINNK